MTVANRKNIQPAPPGSVNWDPADLSKSLRDVLAYVEGEAEKAINWYWQNKRWKSRLSRFIQFAAIALTAGAGLAPIITQIWKVRSTLDSGLLASVFVGVAAALIGLDRAFGFSTGWARYVLTATSIHKALDEFRLDWASLSANLSQPPKSEQLTAVIQRARDFISAIEGLVLQETKDWIAEFQGNMAQLEKDVKTQLDALKAQADKAAQSKEAATKPGAIELTVPNADKTDGFKFQVTLENQSGKVADESVANAKSWARINVAPGQYRLTISAAAGGKPTESPAVVEVKPGEVAKPSVALSIS
jgi:hypothetical protein